MIIEEIIDENLRAWFGKGKKGGAGGGGWDRYNTKGERIGKCGDRKPGEGKPKCLSKSRAASLRAKGDRGIKICKRCLHECHCDERDCPKCVNDVCGWCDCGDDPYYTTDARKWPYIDSGIERSD